MERDSKMGSTSSNAVLRAGVKTNEVLAVTGTIIRAERRKLPWTSVAVVTSTFAEGVDMVRV